MSSGGLSRRSFVRTVSTASVAGALGWGAITGATAQSDTDEYEAAVEQAIHQEVNSVREERSLDPLAYSDSLGAVADYHSEDMADRDYFSHTSPDGETMTDRLDRFGLECRAAGENILYTSATDGSPEEVASRSVDQWMDSPGHRENILGDWTEEGIGAAITADGVLYLTQNFGTGCEDTGGDPTPTPTTSPTPSPTETPTETPSPSPSPSPSPTPTGTPTETPPGTSTEPPDQPPRRRPDQHGWLSTLWKLVSEIVTRVVG